MMFELTITAPDIDAFVRDPSHPATAEGYVLADQFGGRVPVERGWFNLFVKDGPEGDGRKMLYRLWLRDPGGTPLTFLGHKDVRNDPGFDVWADTTTLYVTVLRGHLPPPDTATAAATATAATADAAASAAAVAGAGVLYIRPWDFARQLTTFRAVGPSPASALAAFGKVFLGELWQVYSGRVTGKVTGRQ
jgi:cholesterol oxidase